MSDKVDTVHSNFEVCKTGLSSYLAAILHLKKIYPNGKIIELGNGKEEWLRLFDENNLGESRTGEFRIECGDGLEFIKNQVDTSAIIINGFNEIEKLSLEDLQLFMSESLRVLKPGGLLILETSEILDLVRLKSVSTGLICSVFKACGYTRTKVLSLKGSNSSRYGIVGQNPGKESILSSFDEFFFCKDGILSDSIEKKLEIEKNKIKDLLKKHRKEVQILKEHSHQAWKHLDLMINSRAWRVTKPLRGIAHFLRWLIYGTRKFARGQRRRILNIVYNNTSVQRPKQIFVDVSALIHHDAKTGIQRVVRSVLDELLRNPPEGYCVKPVYSIRDRDGYFYSNKLKINEKMDEQLILYSQDVFLGLDLQHEIVKKERDTYKEMRQAGVAVQFVVYDLLPILHPDLFGEELSELHVEWLKILAENNGVICISDAVANELKFWMKENQIVHNQSFEISSFHLGADIENSVPSRQIPSCANDNLSLFKKRSTFLMVGTIEPRKGHAQTLLAFELLWKRGIEANLVIVGKKGWHTESFIEKLSNHPESGKKLFWLDGISDEYLEQVYLASTCLISSSKAEGFGLPLIESAQKKLPIIARDIPVFREVAREFAFYFENKEDPLVLASAVDEWLKLYANDQHPKSTNMPWLTWKQSTAKLVSQIISN